METKKQATDRKAGRGVNVNGMRGVDAPSDAKERDFQTWPHLPDIPWSGHILFCTEKSVWDYFDGELTFPNEESKV